MDGVPVHEKAGFKEIGNAMEMGEIRYLRDLGIWTNNKGGKGRKTELMLINTPQNEFCI